MVQKPQKRQMTVKNKDQAAKRDPGKEGKDTLIPDYDNRMAALHNASPFDMTRKIAGCWVWGMMKFKGILVQELTQG